jgi:hypothetical protein
MTTEVLCRHFSRIGARIKVQKTETLQRGIVRINVERDRSGEFFDLRYEQGFMPLVLDVRPDMRHLVLMVRDGQFKNKFLLGRDEQHWFAAALPGDFVRDVRTAIQSLRPRELGDRAATRQGEWFFAKESGVEFKTNQIHKREPLSRGGGSKPHVCEELARVGGVEVMVSPDYQGGIELEGYERLIARNPRERYKPWRRMTRDATAYVRGAVKHPDHKTIHLDGWHRVYLNQERFARHAPQIAFLD